MSTQTQLELNAAQAAIYTRSNIRRAFQDFDDTEVAGIYLRNDDCLVVRRDGSEQAYNRELIKVAFTKQHETIIRIPCRLYRNGRSRPGSNHHSTYLYVRKCLFLPKIISKQ